MTQSEIQLETWVGIPGFSSYQASSLGKIRSVDRMIGGRKLRGVVLRTRVSGRGYELVNLTDDDGVKQTRSVHTLVLRTFVGPPPPGQETLHGPGGPLDNSLGNLSYGTRPDNDRDRYGPEMGVKPPPTLCACGKPVTRGSKSRCHDCVVQIGQDGAELLRMGYTPGAAAVELEYPSADGLVRLAVKYGGYVESLPQEAPAPWSQRVTATVRGWLRRKAGK
jgi:NUMOD4 motif